jgi:tetratricopeptide (TPR) repeat protein
VARFVLVSNAILLALVGCKRDRPDAPAVENVGPPARCPSGYSIDPPRRLLEPGIRAFRDQNYQGAQESFSELSAQYESCATCLVWHADAILFDKGRDNQKAARDALPLYERAEELHEEGCTLPRRPRYYLLMGEAYAALRLARVDDAYDEHWLQQAIGALVKAEREFPTSAEVPYNRARAECALAQVNAPEKAPPRGHELPSPRLPSPSQASSGTESKAQAVFVPRPDALDQCVRSFKEALASALRQERPRFLRTHRSAEDWIVRSRTQSEFGPLRATPRYETIVKDAISASPQRL